MNPIPAPSDDYPAVLAEALDAVPAKSAGAGREVARSPVVDHLSPGSAGGDWLDESNLVTACWPCNGRKAEFTIERLG
jgi:hypothetical protein